MINTDEQIKTLQKRKEYFRKREINLRAASSFLADRF